MSNYAPEIVDKDTGEINFPPVKQDKTDVYVHNLLQAMDEMNTQAINHPLKMLLVGKNEPTELNLKKIDDHHYSHELIKEIDTNPNYIIHTDIAKLRQDSTYGNTTLYHLTDPKEGKYLYEQDLQSSYNLSAFYSGDMYEEPGEIEYGVGDLDDYIRPYNTSVKSLHFIFKDHYYDKEAHSDINPKFLIRQDDTKYNGCDIVWPIPDSHPNYFCFEAIRTGSTAKDIEEMRETIESELLNQYFIPLNKAASALHFIFQKHYKDEDAHENINPTFFIRKEGKKYSKKDTVWPVPNSQPNYLYLEAYREGITEMSLYEMMIIDEVVTNYKRPYNVAYTNIKQLITDHDHDYNPSQLIKKAYHKYKKNDMVWSAPDSYPNYLYLEALNTGLTDAEWQDLLQVIMYEKPNNRAIESLMVLSHIHDHDYNPRFFFREEGKHYHKGDVAGASYDYNPNYLYLEALNTGLSDMERQDLDIHNEYTKPYNQPLSGIKKELEEHDHENNPSQLLRTPGKVYKKGDVIAAATDYSPTYLYLEAINNGIADIEAKDLVHKDEYSKAHNEALTRVKKITEAHEVDEKAHYDIVPPFIVRRSGRKYKVGDIVYPSGMYSPNYLYLEAIKMGISETEDPELVFYSEYSHPYNIAYNSIKSLYENHTHELLDQFVRQQNKEYDKDDVVWISSNASPNYFYLQAINNGITELDSEDLLALTEELVKYIKPYNAAYKSIRSLITEHKHDEDLSFVLRKPLTQYKKGDTVFSHGTQVPGYLYLEALNTGLTDGEKQQILYENEYTKPYNAAIKDIRYYINEHDHDKNEFATFLMRERGHKYKYDDVVFNNRYDEDPNYLYLEVYKAGVSDYETPTLTRDEDYKRPYNQPLKGIRDKITDHDHDYNPSHFLRQPHTKYYEDETIYPNAMYSPNYLYLKAIGTGITDTEYQDLVTKIDARDAKNVAHNSIYDIIHTHFTKESHIDTSLSQMVRRKDHEYQKGDIVWAASHAYPNYFYLTALNNGITEFSSSDYNMYFDSLAEYIKPKNMFAESIRMLLEDHEHDFELSQLVRHSNTRYNKGDVVAPVYDYNPNYLYLEAINLGRSDAEYIDLVSYNKYEVPKNIAASELHSIYKEHEASEDAHENSNPSFLIRKQFASYKKDDIVWLNHDPYQSYLYLQALTNGVADLYYEDLIDTSFELVEYNRPKNVAYHAIKELITDHDHWYNPSHLLRQANKQYKSNEIAYPSTEYSPNYLYLMALNLGVTDGEKQDLVYINEYEKPHNVAHKSLQNSLVDHLVSKFSHNDIFPYYLIRQNLTKYYEGDTVYLKGVYSPSYLYLEAFNTGITGENASDIEFGLEEYISLAQDVALYEYNVPKNIMATALHKIFETHSTDKEAHLDHIPNYLMVQRAKVYHEEEIVAPAPDNSPSYLWLKSMTFGVTNATKEIDEEELAKTDPNLGG